VVVVVLREMEYLMVVAVVEVVVKFYEETL
jgi:hypothetical protein